MPFFDVENVFTYHPPHGSQITRYEMLRELAKQYAGAVDRNCPDSREKSLALTTIQQATMWANAAIAINE